MWFIDFYLDYNWIQSVWPIAPKRKIPIKAKAFPGCDFTILIFGDDYGIKHVRIIGDLHTKEEVEKFINHYRQKIQNSIELIHGSMTGDILSFAIVGKNMLISYGEYTPDSKPLTITQKLGQPALFDYSRFENAFRGQWSGFEPYCFYLRMAFNETLPIDYRWLNYYRILETRFNTTGDGLDKNPEFLELLKKANVLSKRQLMDIRGSIHAFARGGHAGIGQYESKYGEKMEETLPAMRKLAAEAINTHPDNHGLIISGE